MEPAAACSTRPTSTTRSSYLTAFDEHAPAHEGTRLDAGRAREARRVCELDDKLRAKSPRRAAASLHFQLLVAMAVDARLQHQEGALPEVPAREPLQAAEQRTAPPKDVLGPVVRLDRHPARRGVAPRRCRTTSASASTCSRPTSRRSRRSASARSTAPTRPRTRARSSSRWSAPSARARCAEALRRIRDARRGARDQGRARCRRRSGQRFASSRRRGTRTRAAPSTRRTSRSGRSTRATCCSPTTRRRATRAS